MRYPKITDWDDAYDNIEHVPNTNRYLRKLPSRAERFRKPLIKDGRAQLDIRYGPKPRNLMDIFLPDTKAKGLVVFVHGGYWRRFDKSIFSHLAKGALVQGYAVAIPSYTLCPDIKIQGIVKEIGLAITHAAKLVKGPIYLSGHSAGGHLVARMISETTPLSKSIQKRIANTIAISGLHDLRPLLKIKVNDDLRLTQKQAEKESPALLKPIANAKITCWVGATERSEFMRQNALLANIWQGLGADVTLVEEQDRHHFSIVNGLEDPQSDMIKALLD